MDIFTLERINRTERNLKILKSFNDALTPFLKPDANIADMMVSLLQDYPDYMHKYAIAELRGACIAAFNKSALEIDKLTEEFKAM